ncbi:hypothetical protein DASC09_056980 [Saccharomycopsis crataegensis]|uniref:C2 domain-containing protein n=1 Tax=Saccharomycopsis crataegensis TaxID=43959 RepID=A0AAV5QUA2_9ASCO|nr:hypothetical protein DASC09_056980 [Saccharomycopsis crataegensis]
MNRVTSIVSGNGSLSSSLSSMNLTDVSSINIHDVYLKVLQVAIIDYRTEPRFRTPIITPKAASSSSPASLSASSSSTNAKRTSYSAPTSSSKPLTKLLSHFDSKEESENNYKLPKDTLKNLKAILDSIAIKASHKYLSDGTRRCMLSFYTMIPQIPSSDTRNPSYLINMYTKAINKEIPFIRDPNVEVNAVIFKELSHFISILIEAIRNEKNTEAAIAYLKETKSSMDTKTKSMVNYGYSTGSSASNNANVITKFTEPSFLISEMPLVQLVGEMFFVDKESLQHDVRKLKDSATEIALQEDLKGIISSAHNDSGVYFPSDFLTEQQYKQWKDRESMGIASLLAKLKRPSAMDRQSLPTSRSGPYYIIPSLTREYYIKLLEVCLKYNKLNNDESLLFSNTTNELIQLVSSYWRVNDTAKAALLFTAANNTVINLTVNTGEIVDIDTTKCGTVINTAFRCLKHDDEMDILEWPEPDKKEWVNNVQIVYLQIMGSIRKLLACVFEPTRPKFNKYIMFLLDYVQADPSYEEFIVKSGLTKKWERRLTIAVGKAIDGKYVDILSKIPRDSSLTLLHVYNAAIEIIETLQQTQARFKQSFLGIINIVHLTTQQFTSGFGRDSRAMLYHIVNRIKEKEGNLDSVNYDDAISIYKKLCDVRFSYEQVMSVSRNPFPFNLEQFFYPFVENFVHDCESKIKQMIINAFEQDNFEVLEDDPDKVSGSVKNCLRIFNQNLSVLKDLGWENEYQLSKLYTIMIKGICESITTYGYKCLEIITMDLNDASAEIADFGDDGTVVPQDDENNAMKWLSGVRAAVTGNQKVEPPKPYKFKERTCVLLNNIGAMLQNIDKIEDSVNPENISAIIQAREGPPKSSSSLNLFSIKIVKAENLKAVGSDGFSDTYVMLTDSSSRSTVGKTRKILDDLNPQFNEEFEFTVPMSNPGFLTATVWDDSKSTVRSHEILGRATIHLDPRKYNDNGIPHDRWYELDTQGRLMCSISMESEKVDALFCLGRAHRSLVRIRDRSISLMVNKFSKFIFYSLSRSTLKTTCGNNGSMRPGKDTLRGAISPLGNYLNSNLFVLAEILTNKMLIKVMLECWSVVLTTADLLLLPPLSSARNSLVSESNNNIWQNAIASLGGNSNRPLTQIELEITFEWLKILCVEFFYANGEGPPLEKLQDHKYQTLLLVPVHYVTDVSSLVEELQQLIPSVNRYIKEKNYYDISDLTGITKGPKSKDSIKLTRSGTVARSKTIMAQGSAKARAQAKQEVKAAETDPLAVKSETEDIILRILIAKGQKSYVAGRLQEREAVARITQTEILAKAAANGIRIV